MASIRTPLLTPTGYRRLHLTTWLLCVVTYVGVLGSNLAQGGTDLLGMLKAMAATLAVALLARLLLGILSRATREVRLVSDEASRGSLLDLVADESPAPLDADGSGGTAESGLSRG